MKAVILAGGKGTRLFSLTQGEIPKPMVLLLGKPILEHQLMRLKENGITDIIISVGHLKEKIKEYFKDGKDFGVNIEYIEENEPLGSGGALYFLKGKVQEDFLLLSGDTVFDIDIARFKAFHDERQALISLFVHPNTHPYDSDLVLEDESNKVTTFVFKNQPRDIYKNKVNAGFFIINPSALDYFTELKKLNLEHDFINYYVEKGDKVYAYTSTEYIKDVGTPDRIEKATLDIKNGVVKQKNLSNKQKCIFLDRDGTINVYKDFIKHHEDIELLPSVAEAIKKINESEYLAIVVTNQPVIARGEATREELSKMHDKIETLLGASGSYIDKFYYCPHHPHSGFEGEIKELKFDCECRKPKIGMLKQAQQEFNIDFENSFIIGDSFTDVKTGINAGVKTIKLPSVTTEKTAETPNYFASNLEEAVDIILR